MKWSSVSIVSGLSFCTTFSFSPNLSCWSGFDTHRKDKTNYSHIHTLIHTVFHICLVDRNLWEIHHYPWKFVSRMAIIRLMLLIMNWILIGPRQHPKMGRLLQDTSWLTSVRKTWNKLNFLDYQFGRTGLCQEAAIGTKKVINNILWSLGKKQGQKWIL